MTATEVVTANTNWQKVNLIVEAYEIAFHEGQPVEFDNFILPATDPDAQVLLLELIRVDLEFGWTKCQPKELTYYQRRYPELFADPKALQEIAYEEFRLRLAADQVVSPSEYAQQYGIDTSDWAPSLDSGTQHVRTSSIQRQRCAIPDLPFSPNTRVKYPQPGEVFCGFQIRNELGRGAFARVYLAEQSDLAKRLVALKVSTQLMDESQTLARLQHTNIVPIYSSHRAGSFHAVCMPYLGRTTLADVVSHLTKLPGLPTTGEGIRSTIDLRKAESTLHLNEAAQDVSHSPEAPTQETTPLKLFETWSHEESALWIVAECADGLAHAHARGILHRDLKPANVLLDDEGRPLLLDFNLAVKAGDQSTSGGTPAYMAPEQLLALSGTAATVDQRADVYALGLILHELLTGRPPHDMPTGRSIERIEKLVFARQHRIKPSTYLRKTLRPATLALVLKCLEPRPDDRYESASQLRDDLRRQLAHEPLRHTKEPSLREQLNKFAKRNPWLTSTTFLATVLVAVLAITLFVSIDMIRQRNEQEQAIAVHHLEQDIISHRLALVSMSGDQQSVIPRQRLSDTWKRFGLHGSRTAGLTKIVVDWKQQPKLRLELLELSLLAAATATDSLTETNQWLTEARRLSSNEDESQRINEFEHLLRNPAHDFAADPDHTDSAHALVLLRRGQYRELKARIEAQSVPERKLFEWMTLAQCESILGRHEIAFNHYTTALALTQQPSAALWAARGRSAMENTWLDEAISDFDQALIYEPDQAAALIDRGLCYLRLGKLHLAQVDIDRAAEVWPSHTRLHFVKAEIHRQAGRMEQAKAERSKGFESQPGDAVSYVARGMAYLNDGDFKRAKADFEKSAELYPQQKDAWMNLAVVAGEHEHQPEQAATALTELLKHLPDDRTALAARGVYRARMGQRALAHADAEAVLNNQPTAFEQYQVAGIYAQTSKTHPEDGRTALTCLASAFRDHSNIAHVANDPDLLPILKDHRYLKLLAAVQELQKFDSR